MAKRTAKIITHVALKINVGNYETVDVSSGTESEIEFGNMTEFEEKNRALTAAIIKQLKSSTEQALDATGRKRIKGGVEVGLWQ